MDIQFVFNEYKAVLYMKTEDPKQDQYSQLMKEVAKEAFENNLDFF